MVGAAVARMVPSRFSMKKVPATRRVNARCARSVWLPALTGRLSAERPSSAALESAVTLLLCRRTVWVVVGARSARVAQGGQLLVAETEVGRAQVVCQLCD